LARLGGGHRILRRTRGDIDFGLDALAALSAIRGGDEF
jgi:hypothetical protein